MPPKYAPQTHAISTLLEWAKSGEIAIPEIQRPFVWDAAQVRDLLDSLYKDYPIGYLITWKSPKIRLKDGSSSDGKRILIDGQQRMTALMAAVQGREVVTRDYKRTRIRIAFNPIEKVFEVSNSVLSRNHAWISDISALFHQSFDAFSFVTDYCNNNELSDRQSVFSDINNLLKVVHNPVGVIELDSTLDIETVTEIFIRVNSKGVALNQADFAMSKIAVNENHNGPELRKAIDYFCHLCAEPGAHDMITRNDRQFVESFFYNEMKWLKYEKDDLYDPEYSDLLRVVFATRFRRGKMGDLVALLSGRNFESREYEDEIVSSTFMNLTDGVRAFINENHFKTFTMIIRSAGFVDSSLIRAQMALNVAYMCYLTLRDRKVPTNQIEQFVRKWFVMSLLTGRYSGSFETQIDQDMRDLHNMEPRSLLDTVISGELSEAFWEYSLPQSLETSARNSPYFNVFLASQVKANDYGFLSRDFTVQNLIENKSDIHHLFPRDVLKKAGHSQSQFNQIANYAVTQSDINIQIGNKSPAVYMAQVFEQSQGGSRLLGNLDHAEAIARNLQQHCIPEGFERMTVVDYPEFLDKRRQLMARKLRDYFHLL